MVCILIIGIMKIKLKVNEVSSTQTLAQKLLAEKYPTRAAVTTEIINLKAILNLPKSTESFNTA